jgi:hypothetical protein
MNEAQLKIEQEIKICEKVMLGSFIYWYLYFFQAWDTIQFFAKFPDGLKLMEALLYISAIPVLYYVHLRNKRNAFKSPTSSSPN